MHKLNSLNIRRYAALLSELNEYLAVFAGPDNSNKGVAVPYAPWPWDLG